MRSTAYLLVLSAFAGSTLADARVPAQGQLFRTNTQLVSVDVSVLRGNVVVAGLTGADFDVRDNGVLQKAEVQPTSDVPLDVSLVFDENFGARYKMAPHYGSDLVKIARILRPGDRLRVIQAMAEVRESIPMTLAADLLSGDSLSSLEFFPDLGKVDLKDPGLEDAAILDAVFLAMVWPSQMDRRHLVIPFTPGADGSALGRHSSFLDTDQFRIAAERSDASLHPVLLPPLRYKAGGYDFVGTWALPYQASRRALAAAAEATGGEVRESTDDVGAFKSVFEDFSRSYVLRYTLEGVAPEGWHKLTVTVPKHKEFKVLARSGYFGK